ncbi:hypothetical protein ACFWPH_28570 [Nocardia sp. NPDC058499]
MTRTPDFSDEVAALRGLLAERVSALRELSDGRLPNPLDTML